MRDKLCGSKFLLLVFVSIYANAQPEWKLIKDKEGVQLFTRNHTGSKIKELKAIKVFKDVTVKEFYDLFMDADNASRWSYLVNYSKVLIRPSESEVIAYFQMDTPWPLKSRDMVQRQIITLNQDKSELVCISTSLPDYIARKSEFVRVEESDIKWTIKQISRTDVQVTYEFFSDPHVKIPSQIEQGFISNGPISVLEKLEDYFKMPKMHIIHPVQK